MNQEPAAGIRSPQGPRQTHTHVHKYFKIFLDTSLSPSGRKRSFEEGMSVQGWGLDSRRKNVYKLTSNSAGTMLIHQSVREKDMTRKQFHLTKAYGDGP